MVPINLRAATLLVAGFLIGSAAWALSRRSDLVALLVCGTIFLVGDLGMRALRRQVGGWWWSPLTGGAILRLPVWVLGLVQLGAAFAPHHR